MMSDSEELGMAVLAPLRSDPLGPSSVDLEAAMRAGQKRRLHRRAAAVGSAALALAVIVGTGVLVGGGPTTAPSPPATNPPTSAPALAGFDVAHQAFTVEPANEFTVAAVVTGRESQTIWLGAGALGNAYVVMYAPGVQPVNGVQEPIQMTQPPASPHRIEPINGRPAYRAECAGADEACAMVTWEWSDGAWATATVEGNPAGSKSSTRADALANAVLLATGTTYVGASLPIRTPIAIAAPPGTALAAVMLRHESQVTLVFLPLGAAAGPNTPTLEVSLRNDLLLDPAAPATVDGKPAWIEDSEVTIYDIAGDWSLRVTAQPTNLLGGREQLLAFARTVQVVANPDDRATWLTL